MEIVAKSVIITYRSATSRCFDSSKRGGGGGGRGREFYRTMFRGFYDVVAEDLRISHTPLVVSSAENNRMELSRQEKVRFAVAARALPAESYYLAIPILATPNLGDLILSCPP